MIDGVIQTIFAGRDDGVYGNCLQAAVATLLELPLDAVPHFGQFEHWTLAVELWARGHDLTVRSIPTTELPAEDCIVGGKSPRGVSHCVVAKGGEVVWDPHPSRAGLTTITEAWFFEPWAWDRSTYRCWACGHCPGHCPELDA